MNSYSLVFTFDAKKPLKTALLVLALGIDIVNIAFLVSAIGGDFIKFAYLGIGILIAVAMRLSTLKMVYSVKYVFKDGLRVYKVYPHKQETVFFLAGEFSLTDCGDGKNADLLDGAEKMYVHEGDARVYVFSMNGKNYALALDDYMLALVLSFYGKKAE